MTISADDTRATSATDKPADSGQRHGRDGDDDMLMTVKTTTKIDEYDVEQLRMATVM